MLVFNPFADPFDDPVADAAPQTVTATAAALPASKAEPAAADAGTPQGETAAASVATETAAAAMTEPAPQAPAAPTPSADTAAAQAAPVADAAAPAIAALAEEAEPLATDDPRWGGAPSGGNPLVTRKSQFTDDTSRTAFAGDLPSAQRSTARAAVDDTDEDQGDIGEAARPAAGMVKARIRSSVNMRSRGADGAPVLGVVPGGAEVSMAEGCRHWCKIVYDGRTGYVYKSFIRR